MNDPHHHIFYQYVTSNGVIGVYSSAIITHYAFYHDTHVRASLRGLNPSAVWIFPTITHYEL